MSRSVVRWVVGIFAVVVLLAGAIGGFAWWKISGLKESLVRELGHALGAEVQVASLDFDLWHGELHAAGISLVNVRPDAPWDKGDISQATVHFHLSDVFASTLPLTVDVSAWNVVLHSDAGGASAPSASAAPTETNDSTSGTKRRVHVTNLTAQEGSVEIDLANNRKVLLHGVGFTAENNGAGVWTTQLQANSVAYDSLAATAGSVQIRSDQDKLTFSNLRMTCDQGLITGDGERDLASPHQAHVTLKITEVPVTMLVAVQWQMKLTGQVTGDLTYDGNDQGGSATGAIALNHAKFNFLPWLGKMTAMVGLADISDVEVDKATSDYTWKDAALHLSNIDVRKNDVTRIAGTVDVDPTGQIDGKLKLGLPSTVTSKWPQLQTQVFTVQNDDYNWADVHLTGTPDHLQEDLSSRLLTVGLQQGGDLLDAAKQKASDLLKSFMGN